MLYFQILDVHSQDRDITKETEDTKEVIYINNDIDNDEDYKPRYSSNKSEMVIHLFGTTEKGESLRVTAVGFEPYFYVELPDKLTKTFDYFKYCLKNSLKNRSNVYNSTKLEIVEKEKLYGYTNSTKFSFVKISVQNLSYFYTLKRIFLDEKNHSIFKMDDFLCKTYEANLDPMLRFFHLRGIQPCGWVEIDAEYESTIEIHWEDIHPRTGAVAPFNIGFWDIECFSTNGDFPLPKKDYYKIAKQLHEKVGNYNELKTTLIKCIETPYTPPSDMDGIFLKCATPPFHKLDDILSESKFKSDIEHYFTKEHNIDTLNKILKTLNKKLPIAGDPVIQIGIVFSVNSKITEQHIFVLNGSDDIDNITVHNFNDERTMILNFIEFLNEKNPDILIGYNVFGFDEKYLYERMEELGIQYHPKFQSLSRIDDITEFNMKKPTVNLQKKFLSSSALGDNNLYIWTTTGRLHIDLYFYIKRIENLASYKLDDVCRHYMSGKLNSIEIKDNKLYIQTKSTKDAEVGKYLVLLDEMGDTILEKSKIIEIIQGKSIVVITEDDIHELETAISWAIVKDDVTPAELFKLHRTGGTTGRATIAKYCIQDCVLVQQLFVKLDVFNNAMAMANTCSVPISFIFTRGQGIKCESLIFKECSERNQLIEVLPTPLQKDDDDYISESYEGAIVLDPKPNFYAESPIGVADFASLYPSTIYSENISYDTLLWAKDFDNNYNFMNYSFGTKEGEKYLTPDVKFTDIEFDIWAPDPKDTRKNPEKIKTGIRICRYVQQANDKKGSLPDIISKLLAARKSKRKEAEKESDPFRKALLDAEQLAYKLTANSLYGQLGSATFKVRLQHLAASTTAYGRKQILFAKDVIETFYGPDSNHPSCEAEIVYGDTDSLFINFKVRNPETKELLQGKDAIDATIKFTEEAGKFVTRCLKKPHDFEYDKVFYPFIIFSKKRYVGNKYEGDSDHYKQTSMGIATKRRDYATIVKNVYGGAIKILLSEKNILKSFDFVQKTCTDLVNGKISEHQLTLTKSLRSEYKAVTPPAHKILANRIALRNPGNAPTSGDRLQFMYILPAVGQAASKLQGDRIETLSYIKENNLKIDYKYYIEHQIYNPITQLFGLFVEQLPGYVAPKNIMCVEERENYAGKLLFDKIYRLCEKYTVRNFANKFGIEVKPSEIKKTVSTVSTVSSTAPKDKKQMTLNFQKLDRFLVQQYDEKKRKERKKNEDSTLVVEV
jgi:DNA polymerase elongation subunit (family B)